MTPITLNDYKDQLERHDWYYYFTDDNRVFVRGERESDRIFAIAKDGTDDYKHAYNEVHKKHFDLPSFRTAGSYVPPFNLSN